MKRIVIYAMGQLFEKYQYDINWEEIIAIVDKKCEKRFEFRDIPVVTPENIANFKFDYVAIFSNKFFKEIESMLVGDYFVPQKKIISWRALVPYEREVKFPIVDDYKTFIKEFAFHSILDMKMECFTKYFFCSDELFPEYFIHMDAIGAYACLMGKNLYKNVYANIEMCDTQKYDVTLLWDDFEIIEKNIREISRCSRYVLIHSSYYIDKIDKIDKFMENHIFTKRIATSEFIFWLIDLSPKVIPDSMAIYVVTHKEYNVLFNDFYKPICVGESYQNDDFLTEKDGDNISYLNEKINECTALYWIWKNSNVKYVGLNHYRRYFCNNNIDYELGIEAFKCIKKFLCKYQPDYQEAFEYVFSGYSFYPFHMFVMRKGILDLYCEWLFSFLIEAAEEMNVRGYGSYDKRAIGFIAERLFTVWLLKQEYKIKELPYVLISK